ncbi:MAG: hypothetical protein ABIQ72_05885 [Usitatibacter sp.]
MKDLDQLLREDASVPVPDNGFSARVMDALPARAVAKRSWLTPALIFGSAALGSLLAVVFAPADISVFQGFSDLVQLHYRTPAAITALGIALALTASAVVLAVETD